MAEKRLCGINYTCGHIALNIPELDYRKYFENPKPNQGAVAYWEDGAPPDDGNPGGGGYPPDRWPVRVHAQVTVKYLFDGEERIGGGSTETPVLSPVSFFIEPYDYDGADIVYMRTGGGGKEPMWGPHSNSFPEATPITGVSFSGQFWDADTGKPFIPPPSPPGGGDPDFKPSVIIRRITPEGGEPFLAAAELEEKPESCWISCEECLENCVQVVKNPGDDYENSICVCKEQEEPEDESMKARVKAELTVELPPIVIARFKATEEQRFIESLAEKAGKIIKPELKNVVVEVLNDSDEEGVSELERVVLNALNVEIDLLPNIYASLKTKLDSEFFTLISLLNMLDSEASGDLKSGFANKIKEILDIEKYTFKSLLAQLDEKNIQELRTKMKIPLSSDDPKNPSNNGLNVNGVSWQIVKNGESVDRVTRAIQPMDDIDSLLNSGPAIQSALQAKYSKNYLIQSSQQIMNIIIFDVSEV